MTGVAVANSILHFERLYFSIGRYREVETQKAAWNQFQPNGEPNIESNSESNGEPNGD